jgi:hypothetical protein
MKTKLSSYVTLYNKIEEKEEMFPDNLNFRIDFSNSKKD